MIRTCTDTCTQVEMHSICSMRFCRTKMYILKSFELKRYILWILCFKCILEIKYFMFSITTENRKLFCTHVKTEESGLKRTLCISTYRYYAQQFIL